MMKTGLIGVVVLSLGAGIAGAQSPDADAEGVTLEQMRERAVARAERRFAALDADGDGLVTRAEFAMAHEQRGDRRAAARRGLGEADTDGDGALSYPELQALWPELSVDRFNDLDADGDGLISEAERPRGGRGPHAR